MATDATEEQIEAGRGYEALYVPNLFRPWPRHLIERADIRQGAHVLDLACGTGVLTREVLSVVGGEGRVVGLDPAPGMLAAAAEIQAGIEWVQGIAEELEFDDHHFDCVVSQFGMMFFEDKQKAAHQMFRVTKGGGKIAIAVWDAIENNPTYGDIIKVLDEEVSTAAGDALRLPFCLGDASTVISILDEAGFEEIKVETHLEPACFPQPRTMVEADLRGWLPLFGIELSEEKIEDVLVQSDKRLAKYSNSSGQAEFQTSAHIISADKPRSLDRAKQS